MNNNFELNNEELCNEVKRLREENYLLRQEISRKDKCINKLKRDRRKS